VSGVENRVWLIGALTFLWVLVTLYGVYRPRQRKSYERLRELIVSEEDVVAPEPEAVEKPFFERVIKPLLQKSSKNPRLALKGHNLELIRQNLMYAGKPGNMTPEEFYFLKIGAALLLPAVVFIINLFSPSVFGFLLMVVMGIAGYIVPDFWLNRKVKSRQQAITKEILNFVDIMAISTEAGLAINDAIKRVCDHMQGVLSQEWRRTWYEISAGKRRADALLDLAERNGVDDLTQLVNAILQAERYGTPIARILRIQAQQLRNQRRHRVQEKAQTATVKIIFPILVFIFAPMMIILVGPALLNLVKGLLF
jgi:tight adherence protein C